MNDEDDIHLQSYQDDLTTDDNATDPVMEEEGENPADELGVPLDEFKQELDKVNGDDLDEDEYPDDIDVRDDQRDYIEGLDENDKD